MTQPEAREALFELLADEEHPCTSHLHHCTVCDRFIPCRQHPDAPIRCGGGDSMAGRDY